MAEAAEVAKAADAADSSIDAFIERWSKAGGSERANYQLFLTELCALLGLPTPDPASRDNRDNAYVFERRVVMREPDGSPRDRYIDLYRRGCFVLECKQYGEAKPESAALALDFSDEPALRPAGIVRGTEAWDRKMHEAREQAKRYVDSLPADEDHGLHGCASGRWWCGTGRMAARSARGKPECPPRGLDETMTPPGKSTTPLAHPKPSPAPWPASPATARCCWGTLGLWPLSTD